MNATSAKAQKYIARARERFGRLTPFRLGLVVGEAADRLRVSYTGHSKELYRQGIVFGKETRERKKQRAMEGDNAS